jgi:tetratricopeptide (TPR) repeat protein
VLGPDHPIVALNLDNLANLLRDRGDLASAEPLYRQAIGVYQRIVGEDHLGLAAVRADLADLLVKKGRLDEAEALFQRSLDARRRLGDANPLTLASQDGLARVAAARARPAAKR